jgi:cell division protein FtsQ
LRIAAISLTGSKEVSREEILTTAGVTGRASLLFLDADAARERLMANPWIGDAAVLKLYPDRLQITVTERQAFAIWQKDGRVSVIAADGTVLEPFVERRYVGLPLVVGKGAERSAKDFLAVIDRYPDIRSQLRASILVAERRWNLRLANGIDVRLPEIDIVAALDRLVALDRDKKLLSRDIAMVDLRLPDRVSVRLSDAAAQARDEALAANKKKKKGGDA